MKTTSTRLAVLAILACLAALCPQRAAAATSFADSPSGTVDTLTPLDSTTDAPTLTAPASSTVTSNPVSVSFTLPEAALNGSVTLSFGATVLTLANTQGTAGAHAFSFNPANPTASAQIASGSAVADGTYTVTLSYQDALGNPAASASSTAVVIDTTAPTLSLPGNIVTTATGLSGAVVNYTASASDPGGSGVASSSFVPASGSLFPLGETTVNASATDNVGNVANGSFTVTVQPSSNADLASLSVSGAVLKPAFNPAVTSYTATVGNAVTTVTVDATRVFPGPMAPPMPNVPAPLTVGNNPVTVTVTAQDGVTTKIYTVNVKRTAVDTTKPVVTITAPTTSPVPAPFTISGKVSEAIGLASVTVRLNGVVQALAAPLATDVGTAILWSVSGAVPENGSNTILVEALDYNGNLGTATKTVTYVNPALAGRAGIYNAVLLPTGTPDVDTTGLVTVTVTATGAFTGSATLSGVKVPFSGTLKNDGGARFKPAMGTTFDLIDRVDFDSYLGALALTVTDPAGLSGTLSTQASGGTVLGNFAGKVAPYKSTNLVPVITGFLNQPIVGTPTKGVYTVVFPSKAQTPPVDAEDYPQGDGFATLTLSNAGAVSLSGYLADGTKYTAAGKLRSDGSVPLFTQLYRKRGAMAGNVTFDPGLPTTDVSGVDFLWVRPALPRARYYRDGWANGIRVDAVGAKYASPASLNFGQGAADIVNGNATLVFSDGGLVGPVTHSVSVNPGPISAGQVKLIPATGALYKLNLSASTGVFSGTFTHDGVTDSYRGILLNKGANHAGFGYFLSTPPLIYGTGGQSGGVSLDPDGP